jgi:hypothetical protein
MIALLALAAFGAIGLLLATAVILEHRSQILRGRTETPSVPIDKHAI